MPLSAKLEKAPETSTRRILRVTALILVVIAAYFAANVDFRHLYKAGAESTISGEGTPRFLAKWVNVTAPPSLRIDPTSASLTVGGTQQFQAYYDADGTGPGAETLVTSSAAWSSDNPTKVTVGASTGLATAQNGGLANITATYSSLSQSVPVTVTSTLSCSPGTTAVAINTDVTFSASGGFTGTYNWSTSPAGTPPTGRGPSFTTQWSTAVPSTKTITLTRGTEGPVFCTANVSSTGGGGFIEVQPD